MTNSIRDTSASKFFGGDVVMDIFRRQLKKKNVKAQRQAFREGQSGPSWAGGVQGKSRECPQGGKVDWKEKRV